MPSGETVKRTGHGQTLLDDFDKPFAGDNRARPLLISEGDVPRVLAALEERGAGVPVPNDEDGDVA